LDGVALLSHLDGSSSGPPHDSLYWKLGRQMAVRNGDWKLVRYDPAVDGERGQPTKMRLYNLADDIGEEHDLSAEDPTKFEQLRNDWKLWNSKNVKPLWGDGKGKKRNRAARQRAAAQEAAL
jgi:arylsulfatase A-like enzyme